MSIYQAVIQNDQFLLLNTQLFLSSAKQQFEELYLIYFLMKMNKGTILIIQLCHFFTVKFPEPTSGSPEGV